VADVGREAVREHLRALYTEGLEKHLARFGVGLQSSAHEVEAARKNALEQLRADADHRLDHQIARAEEDSVYLGCLYDAWKRAREGEPGYTFAQVDVDAKVGHTTTRHKVWAVLKDGKIV
jgi:hypothetical protein